MMKFLPADYNSEMVYKTEAGRRWIIALFSWTTGHINRYNVLCINYNHPLFDLSLFHMQPGIIAGDEVKYNRGYIMSLFQLKFNCRSQYFCLICDVKPFCDDSTGYGAFGCCLCLQSAWLSSVSSLAVSLWRDLLHLSSFYCVFFLLCSAPFFFFPTHTRCKILTSNNSCKNTHTNTHCYKTLSAGSGTWPDTLQHTYYLAHSTYCKLRLTPLHKSV